MTAARNRALQVVPDPHESPTGTDAHPEWSDQPGAETLAAQWEPECQLVGALLWHTATQARPILNVVPDEAIWRPMTRWAYELIRGLVDDGRDPDPVSVLNRAKHQPAAQALQPDTAPTAGQHHRLAVHLSNLYTNTISHHAAPSHARDTLDEAYRRAFREHGIRMQQLGETASDRSDLTEQFSIIRDQLADLWRRAEATTVPGWWHAAPADDQAGER
jgi:replicative DNA helicase